MLTKETVKIISASTTNSMVAGGYRVIRYPVSSATSKNKIVEIIDRTLHLVFPIWLKLGVICDMLIVNSDNNKDVVT